MDRSRVSSLVFAVLLIVWLGTPAIAPAGAQGSMSLQQNVDPDLVNLNVEIQENGDAAWEIEYFVRLSTENETQAFEDLIADVEANRSAYLSRFADRMNATVSSAADSTGREMNAQGFGVEAELRTLGNQYGVLTYTFEWTTFATVSGDEMTAGDALEGFFLDQETTLQFSWPDGYAVSTVSPEPTSSRESTIVWRGPIDFGSGEPSVTFAPSAGVTTTDDGTTTTSATQTPAPEEGSSIWMWVGGGVMLLGLLGAGFWYFQQRPDDTTAQRAAEGPTDDDEPPADLLSNEERVEQFLASEGGRAKQQEIVDGLEWTEAKTSQVLSDMQSNGRIEKFRIGRENVVKLPDEPDEDE